MKCDVMRIFLCALEGPGFYPWNKVGTISARQSPNIGKGSFNRFLHDTKPKVSIND